MRFLILLFCLLTSCSTINETTENSFLIKVDFSKPSTEERLFIYQNNVLILSSYVTHGSGSGRGVYATHFSNLVNSKASSLGRYKIISRYNGVHGTAFKLAGLDSTDSNAEERLIEIHSASYIGNNRTGTSWGCFAVPVATMKILLKIIPINTILIATD